MTNSNYSHVYRRIMTNFQKCFDKRAIVVQLPVKYFDILHIVGFQNEGTRHSK